MEKLFPDRRWETPKSRSVGLLTDFRLYYESLELCKREELVSEYLMRQELSERLVGFLFIKELSQTAIGHLLRELRAFGWVTKIGVSDSSMGFYGITQAGIEMVETYELNRILFLRQLLAKIHSIYVIPGWFIQRLWDLNPKGQGEVAIPAPLRSWNPASRAWAEKTWTPDLEEQTILSHEVIDRVVPGAFPIGVDEWVLVVKNAWLRLGSLKQKALPKGRSKKKHTKGQKVKTFAPRRRLAFAMKEAAIQLLFGNYLPNSTESDFESDRPPLLPRTYMAWCPRLEALELIFYTDIHPSIPGRLIFPVAVFRSKADEQFEKIAEIQSPSGDMLWLHRPSWSQMKEKFFTVLFAEHQKAYVRTGHLYVSLLDIRDEVCRQLRISASWFDELLKEALDYSLTAKTRYSISVETDIREDQRSAYRLARRPIWLNGAPHSLIAMTPSI